MDESFVVHMRFTILPTDGASPRSVPLNAEVKAHERVSCVYLTSSPRDAVRARLLLARCNVCVHCATGLKEALLLLEVVGAKVLLVDDSFPEGTWPDAIGEASERCPGVAVIVAVPTRLACAWEDIIPEGGYEVVLKPFALEEIGPIVRNADRYAREFLSDPAREAREKALLAAIGDLARENQKQATVSGCDASYKALNALRFLVAKASGFRQAARTFLRGACCRHPSTRR